MHVLNELKKDNILELKEAGALPDFKGVDDISDVSTGGGGVSDGNNGGGAHDVVQTMVCNSLIWQECN